MKCNRPNTLATVELTRLEARSVMIAMSEVLHDQTGEDMDWTPQERAALRRAWKKMMTQERRRK